MSAGDILGQNQRENMILVKELFRYFTQVCFYKIYCVYLGLCFLCFYLDKQNHTGHIVKFAKYKKLNLEILRVDNIEARRG